MKLFRDKQQLQYNFPLIIIILAIVVKIIFTRFYSLYISGEDGFVEYFQFLFYLLSCLLSLFLVLVNLKRNKLNIATCYLLLATALFFISMEEISWGQRILQLETPGDLFENNVQGEISLHNIDFFHKYLLHPAFIVIGFIGAFGWALFPKVFSTKFKQFYKEFIPEKTLMLYFLPTFILFSYLQFIRPIEMKLTGLDTSLFWPGDQEVVELILSIGILLHLLLILEIIKQKKS